MQTREISKTEWSSFFERFSHEHEGRLATLEVFGLDIGAQQEGSELPFEGVSVGSHDAESETIIVAIGKSAEDHISHTIESPTRVWLEETNEGASAALEIESKDQSKTLLRFSAAR